MSKNVKYRQCTLEKEANGSTVRTVSYLPEEFAKVDMVLKLKDNDVWTDGWIVKSISKLEDEAPDYRKAIRSHRKNTGDSLPGKNGL